MTKLSVTDGDPAPASRDDRDKLSESEPSPSFERRPAGKSASMAPRRSHSPLKGRRRADPSGWAQRARNVIFTNVGLCSDGSPWWESGGKPYRQEVRDWRGRAWRPGTDAPAAHPNARFIMAARDFPGLSSDFDAPSGVPLSAIFFGGRRSTLVPLIVEANSWEHGVYLAATSRSEAAPGSSESRGALRNDPMGCCRSAATTWRTTSAIGSASAVSSGGGLECSTSTGSAGRVRTFALAGFWPEPSGGRLGAQTNPALGRCSIMPKPVSGWTILDLLRQRRGTTS
jgi:hypothetical protein